MRLSIQNHLLSVAIIPSDGQIDPIVPGHTGLIDICQFYIHA